MDLRASVLTCGQTGSWQKCWQRHFWGFLRGCCQLSKQTKPVMNLTNKSTPKSTVNTTIYLLFWRPLFLHMISFTSRLNQKHSNLFITVNRLVNSFLFWSENLCFSSQQGVFLSNRPHHTLCLWKGHCARPYGRAQPHPDIFRENWCREWMCLRMAVQGAGTRREEPGGHFMQNTTMRR